MLRLLKLMLLAVWAAFSLDASAHGGLSMEKDMCKLRLGPYFMHFTGYQPDGSNEKEFCEDIPATGRTIMVLDDVDHALRELPIEVRIVRDTGSEAFQASDTVLYLPPKVYPAGSVAIEYRFESAGKFVGIISLGDKEQHISRFPFAVGSGEGGGGHWKHIGFVLLVIAAGVLVFKSQALFGKTRSDT